MSNMDPNETLSALRGFTRDVLNGKYIIGDMPAEDMAELFSALDDWLTQGGFLPNEWDWTPRARNIKAGEGQD